MNDKMSDQLDLRYRGHLASKYISLFNKIANEIRQDFTDLIEDISEAHKDNLDWWVSSPASRNIYSSPLFHYCCCLILLQGLLDNNKPIPEILTDSKAFKSILEKKLQPQGFSNKISFSLTSKERTKRSIASFYNILRTPLLHTLQYLFAKQSRNLRKDLPKQPLILIDTFVIGLNLSDRYYPGLWDFLTDEERRCVYFVPTLMYRPKRYAQLFRLLRTSDINFLLKDDYLRFSDYWYAWKYWMRIRKIRVKETNFYGFNIAPLVHEELRRLNGYNVAFSAILNYCFVKRLRKAKVSLKLVIDWFENQVIDKGFNLGLRKFIPGVHIKGYQGLIVTRHLLSVYPTKLEQQLGLIPHEVAVLGKGLVSYVKEFCPNNISVSVAPAFRFQSVWKKRQYYPDEDIFSVLIALPIVIEEGNEILHLIQTCLIKGYLADIRFWIKPHPNYEPEIIKKAFGRFWPRVFQFANGDFNDCIERSNLLISNGSTSSAMNALAKCVPVILIGDQTGLIHNPIPGAITEDIWSLCSTPFELKEAIEFYKNRSTDKIKEHERIGKRIRNDYFEPVTREGVRRFLELNQPNKKSPSFI